MTWQKVRQYHPNSWLLLEALEAHSLEGHRILDKLAVIPVFEDSTTALKAYQELHRKDRVRAALEPGRIWDSRTVLDGHLGREYRRKWIGWCG